MDSDDFSSGSDSDYQPSYVDSDSSYDFIESEDDFIRANESEEDETLQENFEESVSIHSNPTYSGNVNRNPTELRQSVQRNLTKEEQLALQDLEWRDEILPIGREHFTGNYGVERIDSITNEDGKVDLIKIFENLLSVDIVMDMIEHTNNNAHLISQSRTSIFSRIKRWKDVDIEEMKIFFGVIMLMGVVQLPTIEHYWKLDPLYYFPLSHRIKMSYNRFSIILRCWRFTSLHESTQKTYKIEPLRKKLVANFRSLYIPSDTLVVDESMIKFHGRLQIKTYNPSKSNSYGIKIYKMCTVNSYTFSYEIYSGATLAMEGLDKSGSVVVKLCEPLLGEGRLIIADNYYNSVKLAMYLKNRNTDLCGTLRKNRVDLPLRVTKSKLKKIETIARQKDGCITVLKWRDKRDVLVISTCHGDEMTEIIARMGKKMKPNAVIDYNDAKKGIDIADQLASFHSPLRKSLTWYKKVGIDLIFRVAVINARCIYNEITDEAPLSMLQVQETLLRKMLGSYASATKISRTPPSVIHASHHFLTEIPRSSAKIVRKRCTSCYANLKRNGDAAALKAKQVHTECKQCNKAFCLTCFNNYHKQLS